MRTVALRRIATVLAGQAPSGETVHPIDSDIDGIPFIQGNAEFGEQHPAPRLIAESPAKIASPGAILMSVRAPVGALNVAVSPIGIGRGVVAIMARAPYDAHFLLFALRVAVPALKASATGTTYEAVDTAVVKSVRLPDLDPERQRLIADFLARECERIRALSDLLERAAMTADALVPSVAHERLIATGERVELGRLMVLQRGHDLPNERRSGTGYPVIGSGGVVGLHDAPVCAGPGVITGRYGSVGAVHWVDGPHWPLNTTLYVRDAKGHSLRYLYWLLRTLPLASEGGKTAVPGLHRADAHRMTVAKLPTSQEAAEAHLLDELEARVNAAKRSSKHLVARLSAYQEALMTEAVAGQLDVATTSEAEMDERLHAVAEGAEPTGTRTTRGR